MTSDTPPGDRPANRLADETSPYLLQHAHNPVDWYPWGPEALARARAEDKPILLSIGYSACHWCHVMAHESFEDAEVAALMNREFVCIKVDREERPDLDQIYQLGHQMLTGRPGGWPLNMFLDPRDHTPIFGGTYYPREPRHGMPSFPDVLTRVAGFYRDNRAALDDHRAAVRDAFARLGPGSAGEPQPLDAGVLERAMSELARQYDRTHGGFGSAPKFPHPANLEFILRHWLHAATAGAAPDAPLAMLGHTLAAMAEGGIHDQAGGGFCRYSVDDQWMIPHFEKMLYDNGPLLALYAEMAQLTGEDLFARTAAGIARWVMREMQSPAGGYYSSLDADSEGEEGRYYVWDADRIRALVDDREWEVLRRRYRLDGRPNFEGHFHLHGFVPVADAARDAGLEPAQALALLESAHRRLLAAREQRVRPGRDEKILASWNGLMIRGMARAGRLLDEPSWIDSATRAMDFVRASLWTGERLRAVTRDGRTRLNAYLDDYVLVADAALELLQARWRASDLAFVRELLDAVLAHFEDRERGGFFFTSDDHEQLLHRHKPAADDAIASGNGIAAQVLLRAGHLLGEPRYLAAAEATLTALMPAVARYPSAHASLLIALDELLHPPVCVVLRGDPAAMRTWFDRAARRVAPRRIVCAVPAGAEDLPGALAARAPVDAVVAYLCTGPVCSAPITDFTDYEAALAAGEPHARHGQRL